MLESGQSYVKEFNNNFQVYQKQRSEAAASLLSRNLTLLYNSQNLDIYNPDSTENYQFYINLHSMVNSSGAKSDILWMAISILQQASKNLNARHAIIEEFRLIPLFSKVLMNITAQDKIHHILSFLQDLTYGIQITWEEPYLSDLTRFLVEFIYGEDEALGLLSLSILINLCYRNSVCIFLLLRTVRASNFTSKIKSFGILAHKMLIILDNSELPNISDLKNFIKKSFQEIENCMRNWNVPYMRHIVEFITNANDHERLHTALKDYTHFCDDIENLIKSIEAHLGIDDLSHGEENIKNQQICLSLIFNTFDYILEITKHEKLLKQITLKIFNLVINWVGSEYAGAEALNVVRTIVQNIDEEDLSKIISKIEEIVPKLMIKSENEQTSNERTTALLKLLIALFKIPKTEGMVLSLFTNLYFDKIFSQLESISPDALSHAKFTDHDLGKYLLSLKILLELSTVAKSVWIGKVLKLFRTKQIHFIIAKGILCENIDICCIVFEISQAFEFPREEVSKIVTQLGPLLATRECAPQPIAALKTFQTQLDSRMFISKSLEERLDKMITQVFEANRNSEFDNVATSELISMFNYKINLFNNSKKNLMKKLNDASSEITNLSHRLILQSNEMTIYYTMNFKLNLTQERLQEQNSDLCKQLDKIKKITNELSRKADDEKEKSHQQSRSLSVKTAEIEELSKELDKFKKQEASNTAELKHLQATNKEFAARIENFKTNILRFEEALKEKQRILDDKDKELSKGCKTIHDLKESHLKSENIIKHLECQLAEKNESIRAYETELSETEELRKTILSLMESKKPKRKT